MHGITSPLRCLTQHNGLFVIRRARIPQVYKYRRGGSRPPPAPGMRDRDAGYGIAGGRASPRPSSGRGLPGLPGVPGVPVPLRQAPLARSGAAGAEQRLGQPRWARQHLPAGSGVGQGCPGSSGGRLEALLPLLCSEWAALLLRSSVSSVLLWRLQKGRWSLSVPFACSCSQALPLAREQAGMEVALPPQSPSCCQY